MQGLQRQGPRQCAVLGCREASEQKRPLPRRGPAAGSREQRTEGVLQALAAAAEAIRSFEFCRKYGAWVEEHAGALPPAGAAFWREAQQVRGRRQLWWRLCNHVQGVPHALGRTAGSGRRGLHRQRQLAP